MNNGLSEAAEKYLDSTFMSGAGAVADLSEGVRFAVPEFDGALEFRSLPGWVPYDTARQLMQDLLEKRHRQEIPDTVLFLEHEPTLTRGRGLQYRPGESSSERHMPLSKELPVGMAFAESERGGDLTYHGPGQLVMYPLVELNGRGFGPARDVTGFLRRLEEVTIRVLARLGIEGIRREHATGVWVPTGDGPKKVASMGIAVRKWVTYHGIAINAVNDLEPFKLISPCGFSPEVMARLSDLVPEWNTKTAPHWRNHLESLFRDEMVRVARAR